MTAARIALFLACGVLGAGLAWHTFTVGRADRDEVRRASLESLRTLVADVDNKAMSASFGLLPAYDELVRALDALRNHTRTLVDAAKGTPEEAALRLILDRVEERSRQVEDLKRLRSSLSNSERLLRERLAQSEALSSDQAALSAPLAELRAQLLAQRLVPNEERSLNALQALQRTLAAEPDGAQLAAHLDVVLGDGRELTNLTKALLERHADSLTALVNAQAGAHLVQIETHRRQANVGRLTTISLALLLVVASLWLPERR